MLNGFSYSSLPEDTAGLHDVKFSENSQFGFPTWEVETNSSVDSKNLAISSDGNYAIVGTSGLWNQELSMHEGGSVRLFSNSNSIPTWEVQFSGGVTGVDISESGQYIVAVTDQGMLYVWDKIFQNSDLELFK